MGKGTLDPGKIPFEKDFYKSDLNWVHHFLIEHTENSGQTKTEKEKFINYCFSSFGSPKVLLKIRGFKEIEFIKTPAKVIQFFYLSRDLNDSFTYQDFNRFRGIDEVQLTSNQFRLMINKINQRVSKNTSGLIKELIIKQKNTSKNQDRKQI